jgi:RND family efflux transporter MFP subunit
MPAGERACVEDIVHEQKQSAPGWKISIVACCLLLLTAAGAVALIFSTEPVAERIGASRKTAMLVQVTEARKGAFRPVVSAMGTVVPARDIVLRPRVGGRIVELSEAFTPGGLVDRDETVLWIDPADYEIVLQQRRSELRQAVSDLHIEMGRQEVARQDYRLMDKSLEPENEGLVLRRPQLNATRARVESARAALRQAELNLRRTRVKAPFQASVLRRNVNVGSQVSAGDDLGRLVGTRTYWVEATVPLSKLSRLAFPGDSREKGSYVRIRNRSAWPEGAFRQGRVHKLVGRLEDRTRMARVLVAVEDPLARRAEDPSATPALMLGSYVQVRIRAERIGDVVRLDRDYIRRGGTAWVFRNGELDIRELDIVFRDARYAYIRSGLQEGERVVTTNLSTVAEGAPLRLKAAGAAPDARERQGKERERLAR